LTPAEVQRMKAPLLPYLEDWRSIDIRLIAARIGPEGHWLMTSMRVLLDTNKETDPLRTDLPKVNELLVIHERWKLDRLDELLQGIFNGELSIKGEKVIIQTFDGGKWSPFPISSSFVLARREVDIVRTNTDSASYVMELQSPVGNLDTPRRDSIDSSLRVTNPAWDGVEDLIENFVMMSGWGRVGLGYSRLDIVAPMNVRLEGSRLEGDRVTVPILMTPLTKIPELSVSIIATRGNETISRRYEELRDPQSFMPLIKMEERYTLSGKPTRVRIFLGYRGVEVDSEELLAIGHVSAPRARILEHEGVTNLQKLLEGRGDELENGTAVLFHALGFEAANYSHGFRESADIIALDERKNRALVIECTAGVLNSNDKLGKLVLRTHNLGMALQDMKFSPVVVTNISRSAISEDDKAAAQKDRIIVVTSDEIPRMIQMISEGATTEQVVRYLEGLLGSPFG
jgi:hypothetical protein